MAKEKGTGKGKGSAKNKAVVSVKEKPPVDQKLIDEAVEFINEAVRKTIYKGSIEIGNYILDHFYGGNIDQASSRSPRKINSYQELCKRNDLAIDSAQLSVMVRVAAQERYFIEKGIDTEALSYTHKAALVKLDDGAKKNNLVKKIIEKNLSSRELENEIKAISEKSGGKARALSTLQAKAYLAKVGGLLTDTRLDQYFHNTDKIGNLRDATKAELKSEAQKAIDAMEEAISRYKDILAVLEKADTKSD